MSSPSNPASVFDPTTEDNAITSEPTEGEECPFVLMRTVPAFKYHDDLHCFSEPGLTQREYEQAVWAGVLVPDFSYLSMSMSNVVYLPFTSQTTIVVVTSICISMSRDSSPSPLPLSLLFTVNVHGVHAMWS